MSKTILSNAVATGARQAVQGFPGYKTFQAWGATSTGAGAVTVQVQGSCNGGASWDVLGTISVTLSTAVTGDSFTSLDAYGQLRGNVTAISGTGAVVSLAMSG